MIYDVTKSSLCKFARAALLLTDARPTNHAVYASRNGLYGENISFDYIFHLLSSLAKTDVLYLMHTFIGE